jgi:hypothetical protein
MGQGLSHYHDNLKHIITRKSIIHNNNASLEIWGNFRREARANALD